MPLPTNYTDSTLMQSNHPIAHNGVNTVVNDLESRVVVLEAGSGGAPAAAKYLVTEAHGGLSAEVVVGLIPGGELAGSGTTWASPKVSTIHAGSSHATVLASASQAATSALNAHIASSGAHGASQISVADPGGHFTSSILEEVLEELANVVGGSQGPQGPQGPAGNDGIDGQSLTFAMYSQPGPMTPGVGQMRLHIPYDCEIVGAVSAVGVAPAGATAIVDINYDGTSIYSGGANRPTIPIGQFKSQDMVTPNLTALQKGHYLTIDRDSVGSTPAEDLTVTVVLLVSP